MAYILVANMSFTTIQIYTTLKHMEDGKKVIDSFTTIQIYTTLKHKK